MHTIKNKGFTLIELLVVISIIGLLSAVVLTSLNSAKLRAKDAAVKTEVRQLTTLMALNYSDYGDYCELQAQWITNSGTCSGVFSGAYATQAQNICTNIFNNAGENNWGYPGQYKIYTNSYVGGVGACATSYSFMVFLNDGKWYCSGSSGASGEYTNYGDPGGFPPQPGCYANP